VRLAADYSPSRRSEAASEANDVKSSPKMTTPKKHTRPTSRSPMKKPSAGASPRRSPRSAKKHTLRQQAEALKVRGNQNFHAKSYESALQAYTEALAIEFDDTAFRAVLHANKAAALQAMGKFCDAVMECCVSRTYDDGYIRSLQRRADAYLSMGDWPQAMKDLEELEPHMGEDCALKLREAKRKVKNGCTSCEHYSVLGLHSRATKADVTKAYKSLALKFHPDKAPSDAVRPASEALFKRVAEAYAVLKDTAKRAAYDASLTASRIRRTHSM
jgi:tetratricopeptide (TPR) repeat protein